MIEIHHAQPEYSEEICDVLKRSIRELCTTDHNDDPEILDRVLEYKTQESIGLWIVHCDVRMLIAVENNKIFCVGGVTVAGEITLNYVYRLSRNFAASAVSCSAPLRLLRET